MPKQTKGFTIVELLIVIVVLAILTAIAVVSYNGVMARLRAAQSQNDIATLSRAIIAARARQDVTLSQITGRTYTVGPCIGNGVVPSQLDKATHPCWTQYRQALDAIGAAAGVNLKGLYNGTQYGHPFYIDENEGEDDDDPCRTDVIADRGKNFAQTQGDEVTFLLPWATTNC